MSRDENLLVLTSIKNPIFRIPQFEELYELRKKVDDFIHKINSLYTSTDQTVRSRIGNLFTVWNVRHHLFPDARKRQHSDETVSRKNHVEHIPCLNVPA